jgi:hypothetical protein
MDGCQIKKIGCTRTKGGATGASAKGAQMRCLLISFRVNFFTTKPTTHLR